MQRETGVSPLFANALAPLVCERATKPYAVISYLRPKRIDTEEVYPIILWIPAFVVRALGSKRVAAFLAKYDGVHNPSFGYQPNGGIVISFECWPVSLEELDQAALYISSICASDLSILSIVQETESPYVIQLLLSSFRVEPRPESSEENIRPHAYH